MKSGEARRVDSRSFKSDCDAVLVVDAVTVDGPLMMMMLLRVVCYCLIII